MWHMNHEKQIFTTKLAELCWRSSTVHDGAGEGRGGCGVKKGNHVSNSPRSKTPECSGFRLI